MLGERDGAPCDIMNSVLATTGAQTVLSASDVLIDDWYMDTNLQQSIKNLGDQYHTQCVVILGNADYSDAELIAETVTTGDPAFQGPLAGIELSLPVYHICDPLIKAQCDPDVWENEMELIEMMLDVEDLVPAVKDIRDAYSEDCPL